MRQSALLRSLFRGRWCVGFQRQRFKTVQTQEHTKGAQREPGEKSNQTRVKALFENLSLLYVRMQLR